MLSERRLTVVAIWIVFLRSFIWTFFEQAHLDADQAIFGLMASHIADGRAFPVFMYGQTYMLSVESWLAAPLFLIAGPSVWALKLPILAMNIVVAVLLLRLLIRDAGLTPGNALVASAFFVAAPPVTASRLVEAAGGNIEPLLYTLLLWAVRGRPLLFGLIAGIGVVHRPFTWYPVAVLLGLEVVTGALFGRKRVVHWATAAAVVVSVIVVFRQLGPHAAVLGPGTAGHGFANLPIADVSSLVCLNVEDSASNLRWLLDSNLSTLFGWRPDRLATFNLASQQTSGHPWAAWPLAILVVLAGVTAVVPALRGRAVGSSQTAGPGIRGSFLPAYLALVGIAASLAYALLGCGVQSLMLVRYTLLSVFLGVGIAAWVLRSRSAHASRITGAILVALWTSASAWDTARVIGEYARRTPPNKVRRLIDFLDRDAVRFGRAPYWTAYPVTFLSGERIVFASTDVVRIETYQDMVNGTDNRVVTVTPAPPCNVARGVRVQDWCIDRGLGR